MPASFIALLLGIILYVIGVSWLFYIDVMFKTKTTVDKRVWADSAAWAVFIALAGVVVTTIGGIASNLT